MKLYNQRQCNFIIKSFFWSILLYSGMMVALNWDEVRNSVNGRNNIIISPTITETTQTVTTNPTPSSSTNPGHGGILNDIIAVLRTISGIPGNSR